MSPDIFIEDFELTENTEELHAILGRSLIISTRFDNLCDVAAKLLKFPIRFASLLSEDDYKKFINQYSRSSQVLITILIHYPLGRKKKICFT